MQSSANPLMPLSEIQPRAVSWLWPQRLALGKLAMFDGDPGRGKSLVTLDLCARITTGRPLPEASEAAQPANVLIVQGEDFADDTVLPRLHTLGADLARVLVFRKSSLAESGRFSLPSQTEILRRALDLNQPRLLVIDPIMAFLDRSVFAHNDQSVRRALSPLSELTDEYRCACILVRHMNKSAQALSMYRGGGSIGFNAACRSSWLFGADPHDQSRLIMAQIKNNLASPQPSLAYRILPQENAAPRLQWLGTSPCTSNQLLQRAGRNPPAELPRDRACDFLLGFLDGGARPTAEIWPAGLALGLQRRTLQYARRLLSIGSRRVWNGQQVLTYWLMTGQKLPETIPQEHRREDVDDLFAAVREKYPLDPLDEEDE